MNCPKCNSKTKIVDSRPGGSRTVVSKEYPYSGQKVRRRHSCPSCNLRFSTVEVFCEILPRVGVKGPRGKYNKRKTESGQWLEKIKEKLEQ